MKQLSRKLSQVLAGLALCGLGTLTATDATAALVFKTLQEPRAALSSPFSCNQAKNLFVIDQGRTNPATNCGGISTVFGPGWLTYSIPGLVNNNMACISPKVTENLTEYVRWSPAIKVAGKYEVWISYRASHNRASAALFQIFSDDVDPITQLPMNYKMAVNQKDAQRTSVWNGIRIPDYPRYVKLGTFQFNARAASANPTRGYVKLINPTRGDSEAADGAFFKLVTPVVVNPDADTVPVPGDYDGDYTDDLAVYHTSTGKWDIDYSGTGDTLMGHVFGAAGKIPVPGDYDGDNTTDMAVYEPSTGNWDIDFSGTRNTLLGYNFGWAGALPVPGNFDDDGNDDMALYHQLTGLWYIDYMNADPNKPSLIGGRITPTPAP